MIVAPLLADDATSIYFQQLRARRLFSVAEGYCIDRLGSAELSDELRARLTFELSRTLAEHAQYVGSEESVELFERSVRTLEDFLAKEPSHPLRLIASFDRALLPANRGEFLRWQAELFPHHVRLRTHALAALDDAIERLPVVEQVLTERLRGDVAQAERGLTELKPHEVRTMLSAVRYHLGVAHLERAKLFPRSSPERVAAQMAADESLRPVAAGAAGEERTLLAQVRLAESNRLRGEFKQALVMLAAVEKARPPRDVHDLVVSQRMQVFLDEQKTGDALKVLAQYEQVREGSSGELLYFKLRALVDEWKSGLESEPKSSVLAAEVLDQIHAQVTRCDREVGGYWSSRCRALAAGVDESSEFGGELAEAVQIARGAFDSGDVEKAVAAYENAAVIAGRIGRVDQAQELVFVSGSILLDSARVREAGEAFRTAFEQNPVGPKAADAHLLWAWCAGRLFEKSRAAADGEIYRDALAAHLQKFGNHETAAEAAWLLGEFEERRGRTAQSLDFYLQVPAKHARGDAAQAAVARSFEQLLAELERAKQPREPIEAQAVEQLSQFVLLFPPDTEPLTVSQAEVATRLARILMNRLPPDYARSDRLLERVLASVPADTARPAATTKTWKALAAIAARLRIVSLAGQNRFSEATAFVQRLGDASPGEVLGVLDGLSEAATHIAPVARRGLGDLQLKAAEEIAGRRSKLSYAESLRLNRCLAEAYLATGQPTKAIEAYERLLKTGPRNLATLRVVANLLVDCGTDACIGKAIGYWREIESSEKKGSREWLEASYSIARCSLKLKRLEECRKIVRVTRVLYPELGGPDLKSKFDRLERDLEEAFHK